MLVYASAGSQNRVFFPGCALKVRITFTELNLGYLKGTNVCLESKASFNFIGISSIASFKPFLIAWLPQTVPWLT